MTALLRYEDYRWAEGGVGFRQRELTVSAVYDEEYLAARYGLIDEAVRALAARRAAVVEALCGLRTVLDFGCGTGRTVEAFAERGWTARGYDLVPNQAPYRVSWDEALALRPEVVTFFDSLEHLPDPAGVVAALRSRFVVVSVPECHRPDDEAWFMSWKHRRPGEHLWHWDRRTLDRFMRVLGYRAVMHSWFEDAYRPCYDQALPNVLTAVYEEDAWPDRCR